MKNYPQILLDLRGLFGVALEKTWQRDPNSPQFTVLHEFNSNHSALSVCLREKGAELTDVKESEPRGSGELSHGKYMKLLGFAANMDSAVDILTRRSTRENSALLMSNQVRNAREAVTALLTYLQALGVSSVYDLGSAAGFCAYIPAQEGVVYLRMGLKFINPIGPRLPDWQNKPDNWNLSDLRAGLNTAGLTSM